MSEVFCQSVFHFLDCLPENDDQHNHSEHDGADDVNEIQHLTLEGRDSHFGLICELGDSAKDRAVTG